MMKVPFRKGTVTVVIPAYNSEKTIIEALESVLSQTLLPSEIIVIDDGSVDGTGRIANGLSDLINVIRQENSGSSAARNRGIKEARGEWIAFLDADDQWKSNRLESQFKLLRECPNIMWMSGMYDIVRSRKVVGQSSLGMLCDLAETTCVVPDALELLASGASLWTGTVLVKRSALSEVGDFDVRQRTSHDTDMWIRLGVRFPRIGFVRIPIAKYAIGREASLTATAVADSDETSILMLERIIATLPHVPENRRGHLLTFANMRATQTLQCAIRAGRTKHARRLMNELRNLKLNGWPFWYSMATSIPEHVAIPATSFARRLLRRGI
ncbi:glycosyltransferase family 2 protein [Novipirellula artificiosorum]|uniref:UDP-Glc:alpha-D-GlcNAc-diphosphoundecaprenol beta-1,3-glucosyltransferase WfgD n=1 Tax=Novipirellula artificiosorum TaxID=2528016 RepID=A0A5C6D606_9BACT|nr:glycosyltransferase family A protein [Novipirellula artificiosorum]TWU32603.1 UDP-Glc:alpha-D-GlcNAc-diphosphoundecaprenol beta-1,3-glucosyltransferase WfgD [Novipirellula artificiosorum]